jgi:hypothetical protein
LVSVDAATGILLMKLYHAKTSDIPKWIYTTGFTMGIVTVLLQISYTTCYFVYVAPSQFGPKSAVFLVQTPIFIWYVAI